MQKFNFVVFIGLLFTSLAIGAATKTPVGTWQLATTTQIEIASPTGHKLKGAPVNGTEFATFSDDYSYVSSEWVNRLRVYFDDSNGKYVLPLDVFGQWNSKNTSYTVSYDTLALSFRNAGATNINQPFFDRIGYLSLLATDLGYTPTIDKIQVLTYADSGKLIKNAQGLNGGKSLLLKASWKHPDTSESTSATIAVGIKYTGKKHTLSSSCCGDNATQNATDSVAFLTANAALPGVQKTASGLQYMVLQDNPAGDRPRATDTVTVNYRGFYPSGAMFDSGSLTTFALSGVISGWGEGVQLMRQGSKYRFFIPSDLAYGEAGSTTIKANSALIFDVELIKITTN